MSFKYHVPGLGPPAAKPAYGAAWLYKVCSVQDSLH